MFATATILAACLLGIASLFPFGILAWYIRFQRDLRAGPRVIDAENDPSRLFVFSSTAALRSEHPAIDPAHQLPIHQQTQAADDWRRPNYIAPEAYRAQGFSFTIRSGRASLPKIVEDRGGFAVVPFLVYDSKELSFYVRTRLYLN